MDKKVQPPKFILVSSTPNSKKFAIGVELFPKTGKYARYVFHPCRLSKQWKVPVKLSFLPGLSSVIADILALYGIEEVHVQHYSLEIKKSAACDWPDRLERIILDLFEQHMGLTLIPGHKTEVQDPLPDSYAQSQEEKPSS